MEVAATSFGRLPDGTAVELFVLDNGAGVRVAVSSYGAIITSVRVPDREGVPGEVTLGFDTLDEYLAGHPYYGSFVGRVANRISGGGFALDGRRYALAQNASGGAVHLHGGVRGFDKHVYAVDVEQTDDGARLRFARTSADGEEGYPGALWVRRTVGLTGDGRLVLEFEAESEAATVVNLTDHTYWNLDGFGTATDGRPTIMDHVVQLNADRYVAVQDAIPTGELPPVAGTPFDFRTAKVVRRDFDAAIATGANGFDHCWVLADGARPATGPLQEAARVRSPKSGREMVVATSYPGIQFYSGNNLPGQRDRAGTLLAGQEALCLEAQFLPDSPNRPEFPSIVLRPGERYHHRTEHTFRAV